MMHVAQTVMSGLLLATAVGSQADTAGPPRPPNSCVAPVEYFALDPESVGRDDQNMAALGTYERISPDGRFVLRSYSGARLGQVSLIELPMDADGKLKAHPTPLSNEAFPVQGTWRYVVNINGDHYRFSDILQRGAQAQPLFRGGMTGFYAAASEMAPRSGTPAASAVFLRSLSWPQDTNPDAQGVGPLQVATIEVRDDGRTAQLTRTIGPQFICDGRISVDGNAFALPMLSVDGTEFSAIPQAPRSGAPSMRVYQLAREPLTRTHSCDLVKDLGLTVSKAVFGFGTNNTAAGLTYSDLGHVYMFDRQLGQSFRLDHGQYGVLASAFPGLTRDGRVIYGATWRNCPQAASCPRQAGYVVADPYQSTAYRNHWRQLNQQPLKACITQHEVREQRKRFAAFHGLAP